MTDACATLQETGEIAREFPNSEANKSMNLGSKLKPTYLKLRPTSPLPYAIPQILAVSLIPSDEIKSFSGGQ